MTARAGSPPHASPPAGESELLWPDLPRKSLPKHLAIIMDGNGRWAKAHGWRRVAGHRQGAESVRVIVRACRRLGIKCLTLYAFSEENWGRPRGEVSALMGLLGRFLKKERQELVDRGIRLNTIGQTERLPAETREQLAQVMAATAAGDKMVLTLALSYGGRQEIALAARQIAQEAAQGILRPGEVDEATVAARLFTSDLPDPDLLIRTSGELRVSNFLLWQIAYAEFFFSPVLWPDFREEQLREALLDFARRQRRFGKTGEQVEPKGV